LQAGSAKGHRTRAPSLPALARMCCGLFGVQIVWGLQNVNTSRIFQTLGANLAELPILWIAAPITGLLVQPLIGHYSDRTWGPLGRRRPYLLGGALISAAALVLMPNVSSLWAASVMLWLLTGAINVAMEPLRALVADIVPEERRTAAFSMQVAFIGAGAVFASALPWMVSHWGGFADTAIPGAIPASVRVAFYIGAGGLLATVGLTVLTTREPSPESLAGSESLGGPESPARDIGPSGRAAPAHASPLTLARGGAAWIAGALLIALVTAIGGYRRELYLIAGVAFLLGAGQWAAGWKARHGARLTGLLEIVHDVLHMPAVLRRLALVQFFTWFGLFAMWIYAVPAIAARNGAGADPGGAAYNLSADRVGILFAFYNGVAMVVAFALPSLAGRIGRRETHAICLALGAAGLLGFALVPRADLLWIPAIGIGCAWASILSAPYAMVSGAVPAVRMGVYMGIHNVFLVLPQLVATALLGWIVGRLLGGDASLALALAAAAFALAALAALTIPDHAGRRRGGPRSAT
jgi:maltose/moltooligosaccharide transporter